MELANKTDTKKLKLHLPPLSLAGAALGLGLLFDYFFYGRILGISVVFYAVVLVATGLFVATKSGRKLLPVHYVLGGLSIAFAAMVAIRASEVMAFWNIVASLYLLLLFAVSIWRPKLSEYTPQSYVYPVLRLPTRLVKIGSSQLVQLLMRPRLLSDHPQAPQIIRGVAITLPVLIIFGLLFSSADPVFGDMIGNVFSLDLNGELIWRLVLILLVSVFMLGGLAYIATTKLLEPPVLGRQSKVSRLSALFGKNNTESTILLTTLNILFLAFILIQLRYLFAGTDAVTIHGFTYAEYARKGFFELIMVAVLSLLLVLTTERFTSVGERQLHPIFKWLATGLIVQVGIIMVSAFMRLALYEDAYGFTMLRLFSHVFIVWLAVVFVALLFKMHIDRRSSLFALQVFASAVGFLLFVNVMNPEAFITHKNIERYNATGKLDTYYLSSLSADSINVYVDLLDTKAQNRQKTISALLLQQREKLTTQNDYWQSVNLSRIRALDTLNEQSGRLKKTGDGQYLLQTE